MSLRWDQVRGWRLRRQFVDPPSDVDAAEVVHRLCGVHAQVASSSVLAVRLRQVPSRPPGELADGLARASLLRTWVMRGTLHVVRADDAPVFLSVLASARTWEKPAWQRAFGVSPREVEALGERVAELLTDVVLTRDELVRALVASPAFAGMEEQLRSGWAAVLKPLAWMGLVCHGPARGNMVTFTRPATWVPGWAGLPAPEVAGPAALAAYLGAYGPSTLESFGAWLSRGAVSRRVMRGWREELGDRVVGVDVEGVSRLVLREHLDELESVCGGGGGVRLLGGFDQYVLGPGTSDPELVAAEHRGRVSRAAGWISPVVLVDGRVVGVWECGGEELRVSLFPGVRSPSGAELAAEVRRVAVVLGRERIRPVVV